MKQLALDIGLPASPTLVNFLANRNGQALQCLQEGLRREGRAQAPVYLWGSQGCGKSHLLRATVLALQQQGARVGWMDAESGSPGAFDDGWDAVAMDDVQRYDATLQQAAFNWFVNATHPQAGSARWVLAAGALPPADLPLRDDLRSRLGWGQVFQLQPLDEAGCRQVLRQQASERGIALPDEVLDYMLARFARDMGSLAQMLQALDQFALQAQRAVTIPLVRAMLNEALDVAELA